LSNDNQINFIPIQNLIKIIHPIKEIMTPEEMQKAIIKNLPEKTGKTLEEWLVIAKSLDTSKQKELVQKLKTEYGLGHFQAQVICQHFFSDKQP